MSFILDALKKSEADRLRKNSTGIASIPESGRQKSPNKWIWLVLALVTLNLAVLAGLMIKVEQEPSPDENTAATTPMPTTAAIDAASAPVVISNDVAGVSGQDQSLASSATAQSVIVEAPERTAEIPQSATTLPQLGSVGNGLESFNDLRAKGALNLPDMHLDIHVYSAKPADRFVFVNMAKYKEEATLSEGPTVTAITPDGVVLSYRGTAFLLPRE